MFIACLIQFHLLVPQRTHFVSVKLREKMDLRNIFCTWYEYILGLSLVTLVVSNKIYE